MATSKTSSRPRDQVAANFGSRRGHVSQLSISDPSHHVTEAIGTLYGDEDDSGSEGGRPLSFVDGSASHEQIQRPPRPDLQQHISKVLESHPSSSLDQSSSPAMSHAQHGSLKMLQIPPTSSPSQRNATSQLSPKSPSSPTLSLRNVQVDPTGAQFPLTNIDNPTDIAQELSNLQALRRLSMDVGNNIDPDMPPMALSAMPVIAPSGDDDENDPSRLLWVPARVHPELAPTEFKSFLEKRVQSIRRRSGDPLLVADGGLGRSGSNSLARRKSMLSRQIDTSEGKGPIGYVDGAERLERQRSQHNPELSLDELVKDPTKAVRRFAQESQEASGAMEGSSDDMPILPMAPGIGLRRSTRTTYRKGGSLRSGEKCLNSRRLAQRQNDGEAQEASVSSAVAEEGQTDGASAAQVEPASENYSRPTRSAWRQHKYMQEASLATPAGADNTSWDQADASGLQPSQGFQDTVSLAGSSSSASAGASATADSNALDESLERREGHHGIQFPRRSSSQRAGRHHHDQHYEMIAEEPFGRSSRRPGHGNNTKQSTQPQYTSKPHLSSPAQNLNDISLASPSSLSGGDATRTDSLTFIPTLSQAEKKPEKKLKKDRDEDAPSSLSRTGSAWKWLKGVTDDREKKKEESKKSRAKALAERAAQDNVRLDVIPNSIDKSTVKVRESLILDRDNLDGKLFEDRKKESNRKGDSKKEKDGSIFSSFFGGGKKKEEKEKANKKNQLLQVPDEPPLKALQPDVDYNWTRFPLLEERAIYRMAHIKLANPRRSLLSQVLLSNFMYSYLAIVQAMHPQMNVPTSPQQKRLEEEARRRQQEQTFMAQQQTQHDHDSEESFEQYNFDYHRAAVRYADAASEGQVEYVDDAQIYEDEHGSDSQEGYDYERMADYNQEVKDYLNQYRDNGDDHRHHGQDDMW